MADMVVDVGEREKSWWKIWRCSDARALGAERCPGSLFGCSLRIKQPLRELTHASGAGTAPLSGSPSSSHIMRIAFDRILQLVYV